MGRTMGRTMASDVIIPSDLWDEDDPSATILMTQSAPLMVPINPDATLLATVVV